MNLSIQKDTVFHELLASQATVAHQAAIEFHSMSKDFSNMQLYIDRLKEIEHQGDNLTHRLQEKVSTTFITPLDKEDLRLLSQALDDVTDMLEAAAVRARLYHMEKARPDLEPLASGLVSVTALVVDAMNELRHGIHKTSRLESKLRDIHTAENENDAMFRTALSTLFSEPDISPVELIKWKEMYDRMEVAVDKCEDIAKLTSMILTKYA